MRRIAQRAACMRASWAGSLDARPTRIASLPGQSLLRGRRNRDRRPLAFRALFRRALLPTQIERAIDQANVTIGLWKIAQHAASEWIDLFRQQAHVIAA